jgi:hypothetical protein
LGTRSDGLELPIRYQSAPGVKARGNAQREIAFEATYHSDEATDVF